MCVSPQTKTVLMTQKRSAVGALSHWLVILVIVTLAGCAFGRTMRAGDKAFEAGDYEAALAQYEGALKVNPNSEEAAAKLAKTREMLVAEDIEAARAALGAGDLLGAMAAANGAWVQLPDSEATVSIVRDVSNAVYARAQKLTEQRDWANALMLLESLPKSLPSEAERAKPMAQGVRGSWVDQLRTGAEAAVAAGRKGDAALQYAKLTQLTSDPAYGGKRDELRRQVLEEHGYVVKVSARKSDGAAIVLDAVSALGTGTALLVAAKPASGQTVDATARIAVSNPRYRTEETSRNEVATYQSGTRQVENPFYRSKQEEVVREENRLLEYENEVTKLQSDVDRYRNDVAREGDTPNVSTGAEQNLYNAENRLEAARNNADAALGLLRKPYEPDDLARCVAVAHAMLNGCTVLPTPLPASLEIFSPRYASDRTGAGR